HIGAENIEARSPVPTDGEVGLLPSGNAKLMCSRPKAMPLAFFRRESHPERMIGVTVWTIVTTISGPILNRITKSYSVILDFSDALRFVACCCRVKSKSLP